MTKPELIPVQPGDFVLMDSSMQNDTYVVMEVTAVKPTRVTVRPVRKASHELDATDDRDRDRIKIRGVLGRDHAEALKASHQLGWMSQHRAAAQAEAQRQYRLEALALLNKDNT